MCNFGILIVRYLASRAQSKCAVPVSFLMMVVWSGSTSVRVLTFRDFQFLGHYEQMIDTTEVNECSTRKRRKIKCIDRYKQCCFGGHAKCPGCSEVVYNGVKFLFGVFRRV